jgi:hypothetical protein
LCSGDALLQGLYYFEQLRISEIDEKGRERKEKRKRGKKNE